MCEGVFIATTLSKRYNRTGCQH